MPGGTDFRRWYAMRKRLQQEGKWKGKDISHKVPILDLEAGEPAPKNPALGPLFGSVAQPTPDNSPDSVVPPSVADTVPDSNPSTPDSLPPLESPATAEGNRHVHFTWVFINCLG